MGDYIAELLNKLIIVIPALLLGICIGKLWEEVVGFNRPKSNADQHTQRVESVGERRDE